jgi:hypothetical protein
MPPQAKLRIFAQIPATLILASLLKFFSKAGR